jgi:hypothetical protein
MDETDGSGASSPLGLLGPAFTGAVVVRRPGVVGQLHMVYLYVALEPLAFTMTQDRTEAHDTDEVAE